ncbi:hypothetical protein EJ06DRAFT_527188 [Trichodelitschia bisporula]|uniref:Uncharacterized protein n=1 Tax=Trichodelitschia bisporula TaxID=703511 RepID=A0A6G1I5J6_9PEZI|nr:hypothetical protein EJ06DRAFT_527188 [Trichodelitschia bisporula]
MSAKLPSLTNIPRRFPGYCLSLSTPLIDEMGLQLSTLDDSLVLSIGSGSGLLEACVRRQFPRLRIEAVEVAEGINSYLPDDCMHVVKGTWETCSRSSDASAWLFVYPRQPSLITKYLHTHAENVQLVIWLGPKVDWQDFKPCFESGLKVEEVKNCGLAEYEMMVIARL